MRPRRIAFGTVAALGLVVGSTAMIGCCAFSAPGYQGPRSDHFDGTHFHNEVVQKPHRTGDLIRWITHRHPGPWPEHPDAKPGPPPPRRVDGGRLHVTFVNHATVLVQMDGLNVLTDPIWSERASPVSFAGPKRVRPPGIRFDDLPPIDVVLISHDHYDHLDLPTLERLWKRDHPKILLGLGNDLLLAKHGIDSHALDWWQSVRVSDSVEVTAVPAQHFSGRGLCDRRKTLWEGFVISGPSGNVYFAGDTGFGPHFEEIHERFAPIRLALLPIGAFRPEWFMARVHLSPADAIIAHYELGAGTSVGIHFGTFRLADDGEDEAPGDIRRAVAASAKEGVPLRFWILGFGEGRDVPPVPGGS